MINLLTASEVSASHARRVRAGVPTRLANEYFEGELLLFVQDPALRATMEKPVGRAKRYWELQVQGRFLKPVDNFVMGMEATEPLKMSLPLRLVSSTLFSFMRTFEPDLHSSFGSNAKKDGSGGELPHVCTPLFNGADTIVETLDGSGDAPPTLGEPYMGPKLTRAERPQSVRLDATYTFMTFSTFCDVYAWKIKGLPTGAIDIATFLRDSSMRIVAYT